VERVTGLAWNTQTGWRAVIIKQRRRQSDAIAGKIDYKQLILL
jgi:hypothetical protein